MLHMIFLYFLLLSQISTQSSNEFDCKILDPFRMHIGGTIFIPSNSTAPFPIPPNFNCTYKFLVPESAYLRLAVINGLADSDSIEFLDSLGFRRTLTKAIANEEFFATFGLGEVKVNTGSEGNSKALLQFEWVRLPKSSQTVQVFKNASGISMDCQAVINNAVTFETADRNETIALSVAHSGYILDNFDSFFIFDGNDTNAKAAGRLSDYIITPYSPSKQTVTILGLTAKSVYSNVMVNIFSNIENFEKYTSAVVIDQQGATLDSINQTVVLSFVAKYGHQLYITHFQFSEIENSNCKVRAISGTPSPVSKHLVTYTPMSPLENSFPQQFPSNMFSIELTDCSIYVVISKNQPKDFYEVESGRVGYAFTPSYLDPSLTSQLDFTLNSNTSLSYSTVVESVNVADDSQLAINVYNSKGVSAMSIVITGNQTGGSAQAIGTSVNIQFNSSSADSGSAKIRYSIGINSKCSSSFYFSSLFVIFMAFFTGQI